MTLLLGGAFLVALEMWYDHIVTGKPGRSREQNWLLLQVSKLLQNLLNQPTNQISTSAIYYTNTLTFYPPCLLRIKWDGIL